jgi:hypothetical protein
VSVRTCGEGSCSEAARMLVGQSAVQLLLRVVDSFYIIGMPKRGIQGQAKPTGWNLVLCPRTDFRAMWDPSR